MRIKSEQRKTIQVIYFSYYQQFDQFSQLQQALNSSQFTKALSLIVNDIKSDIISNLPFMFYSSFTFLHKWFLSIFLNREIVSGLEKQKKSSTRFRNAFEIIASYMANLLLKQIFIKMSPRLTDVTSFKMKNNSYSQKR